MVDGRMSMSQKILEGASEAVGSDVVNFLDIFSLVVVL